MRRSKKDRGAVTDCTKADAVKLRDKKEAAVDKNDKRRDSAMKRWFKHFTDVAKLYEGKEPPKIPRSKSTLSTSSTELPAPSGLPNSESADTVSTLLHERDIVENPTKSKSADNLIVEEVTQELIEPDHITIRADVQPFQHDNVNEHHHEEALRMKEQRIREQDEIITRAMAEKHRLRAETFGLSPTDYTHVAELAAEDVSKKDVTQQLLACLHESDRLVTLVNDNIGTITNDSNENITSHDNGSSSGEPRISMPSVELFSITNKLKDLMSNLVTGMEHHNKEMNQLKSQLHSLQEQVNLFTATSTSQEDSVLSPSTFSSQSRNFDDELNRLHISELDISEDHSGSRPVSFISVNSEASEDLKDSEPDSDEMGRKTDGPGDASVSRSASSSSSTHSNTREVKGSSNELYKGSEKDLEEKQVLQSTLPYAEQKSTFDDNLVQKTEKLEIVEADSTDFVEVSSEDSKDETIHDQENVDTPSEKSTKEEVNEKTESTISLKDNSKQPIVVSKETLVKNFNPTHMVTSQTQTYEIEAKVTNYMEHIVAETVYDEEKEFPKEHTPQEHALIEPAVVELTECIFAETVSSESPTEEDFHNAESEPETAEQYEEASESTVEESTCMEMDCQTEMDPELLAIIEQQQEQEQSDSGSSSEEEEDQSADAKSDSADEQPEESFQETVTNSPDDS